MFVYYGHFKLSIIHISLQRYSVFLLHYNTLRVSLYPLSSFHLIYNLSLRIRSNPVAADCLDRTAAALSKMLGSPCGQDTKNSTAHLLNENRLGTFVSAVPASDNFSPPPFFFAFGPGISFHLRSLQRLDKSIVEAVI